MAQPSTATAHRLSTILADGRTNVVYIQPIKLRNLTGELSVLQEFVDKWNARPRGQYRPIERPLPLRLRIIGPRVTPIGIFAYTFPLLQCGGGQ